MEDLALICLEDQSLWFNDDDKATDDKYEMSLILNGSSILSESEESYIEILVSKEITYGSEDSSSLVTTDSWLRNARADAIQWIIRTKDYFGFGFATAYLSIAYFDRFLMRRSIDKERSWVVRLLSIACLSLAAKMEERVVPALWEYETDECRFSSNAMQRMELLILSTLDWRMSLVTPFAYLNYFSSKIRIDNSWEKKKKLFSKSVGYIFAVIEDINLVEHRPSTIAAAAILAASDQNLTKHSLDSKLSILSSCGALENEHVLACYALMIRESHEESVVPSDRFVCSESSMNCSSNRCNKRKRLQL